MDPLGPFEPKPRLAVAVSGGADSLALTLLAATWARERGGSVHGLVVDHGIRPEAAEEASVTAARLGARGIGATSLRLALAPALFQGEREESTDCLVSRLRARAEVRVSAERARAARYAALESACIGFGIVHLLLGHHAGDQAETVFMRRLSRSGPAGLAGMAALRETMYLRLLRPLLPVPPARLRATLRAAGLGWVEDPSNADLRALRPRLRAKLADRSSEAPAFLAEAAKYGDRRARTEGESARFLAGQVTIRPEGFAVLPPGPVPEGALSALIQAIGGRPFPPPREQTARLGAHPSPATLAGMQLLSAGRIGPGFLLVREEREAGDPVPASPGAVWDNRFRLPVSASPPPGAELGPLGADSVRFRRLSNLPSAILRVLPAIRCGSALFAVPHLGYPDAASCARVPVLFSPPRPAACARFFPVPGQP
jgi:tRNA(Ile)-lysidine synthase